MILLLTTLALTPESYSSTQIRTRADQIVSGSGAVAFDTQLYALQSVDDPSVRRELEEALAVISAELLRVAALNPDAVTVQDRVALTCSVYAELPARIRHANPLAVGADLCDGAQIPDTVYLFKNQFSWGEVKSWL